MEITVINMYLCDPWSYSGEIRTEWIICKLSEIDKIMRNSSFANDSTIEFWYEIVDNFIADSDFKVRWNKEEII